MDTVYPQPIRLCLGSTPRRKRGSQNRYRTQPVTFSEIKEVDEENTNEEESDLNRRMSAESTSHAVCSSKSSSNVNANYEELFSKKRSERKISKKLQNRLDLSNKPSISPIPASPEMGKGNLENVIHTTMVTRPKIPSPKHLYIDP